MIEGHCLGINGTIRLIGLSIVLPQIPDGSTLVYSDITIALLGKPRVISPVVKASYVKFTPEKTPKEIDFFGEVMVSKGIISLQNDRGTSYGTYIKVQNELIAAYNEVREELAMREFGKHFDDLPKDKQDAIKDYYPQIISEAEPTK